MIFRKAAAALLPLVFAPLPLASASAAQESPPADLRWVAEWGERRCTLARMAPNTTPVLVLRLLPGSSHVDLIFPGRPPTGAVGGARAELVYSDGTRSDVRFGWRSPGDVTPRISLSIESALLDRLASSSAVRLVHRGETLADVPLPRAGAAIAALRRCADSALAEWGVDSAAQAALQRRPEKVIQGAPWITSEDYPPAALRRSSSGEVVLRLTINAAGRVSECAVAVSSGDADLDATSCRLFALRGRYAPALDAEGRPTAASTVEAVIWGLPQ